MAGLARLIQCGAGRVVLYPLHFTCNRAILPQLHRGQELVTRVTSPLHLIFAVGLARRPHVSIQEMQGSRWVGSFVPGGSAIQPVPASP